VPHTWSDWTADIKIFHSDLSFIPLKVPLYMAEAMLRWEGGVLFLLGPRAKIDHAFPGETIGLQALTHD
jgi:hypothetical protein